MNTGKRIAKMLLEIQAVALRDTQNLFTWASGIQSPIYCDNRLTMAYPQVREAIAEGFAALIREKYPEAEVLVGTATAGIPHAAWTAQKLDLPMAYVRSNAKVHGRGNQIEGKVQQGQKVVVIEDLLSTGGSSLKAVKALQEAGADVLGVVAIFSYGFDQLDQLFSSEGVVYHTLTSYQILLPLAKEIGLLEEKEISLLEQWSKNPYIFTEK
ncbi:orotate phosphoribosyltransferase [Geosporobacter ferrireducens]|uniref:Orotate phosphoribosyltransferase n=1 Tax=Geosporobacter ferrireducens TaxID=1424294 RepID=A0A1D8GJ77_9FIRM|nr:orotate phosphoribosyltransferase [Geosporobacter ferrireducens]AOT70971.1 orotate phosphoribosyltransferase [Geosporobacter ferrireducens]MTI53686.1 orotate phosphoribosyltransferase [Geosporobacter ferrireducens]